MLTDRTMIKRIIMYANVKVKGCNLYMINILQCINDNQKPTACVVITVFVIY